MIKRLILSACLTMSVSNAVLASVEVHFSEGAPKDRFIITNKSSCTLDDLVVELDLATSRGKLIFDITGSGAGVEVFQPFESTGGGLKLTPGTSLNDGDSTLSVTVKTLGASESASFTIDVDDTLTVSERGMIIVSGSEIKGGKVTLTIGETTPASSVFGSNSKVMFKTNCT